MNLYSTVQRLIFKNKLNFKISKYYYSSVRANNNSNYNFVFQPKTILGQSGFEKYDSYLNYIVKYLTTQDRVIHPEVNDYFKEILNYNMTGNNQFTGIYLVSTYMHFTPSEKQTTKNMRLAYIMGWIVDTFANSIQIVDDLLDESSTRLNKPCWYKKVGLKAINHASAIEKGAFMLLDDCLSKHPSYTPILKLSNDIKFKYFLNQTYDMFYEKKFNFFTKKIYNTTAMYRITYLAFIYPVLMGLYLAEIHDQKLHSEIRAVLIELGLYLAVQNDILDCYGKPHITGKYGTDISVGKCTWLAVEAMAVANPSQTKLFYKHYGKPEPESQQLIWNLYEELEILKKFLIYEKDCYRNIRDMVECMSDSTSKTLMYQIIKTVYKEN